MTCQAGEDFSGRSGTIATFMRRVEGSYVYDYGIRDQVEGETSFLRLNMILQSCKTV